MQEIARLRQHMQQTAKVQQLLEGSSCTLQLVAQVL